MAGGLEQVRVTKFGGDKRALLSVVHVLIWNDNGLREAK